MMALNQVKVFARQVNALTKKTLFLLVVRHWFSTLIQAIVIPIAILLIVLNSRYWGGSGSHDGIGTPAPIQSLRQSISAKDKFIIVRSPKLGTDVDTVVDKITSPLSDISEQVIYVDSPAGVANHCSANTRGVSGCYAALVFEDSPLTEGGNQTWIYTIRTDPIRGGYSADSRIRNTDVDTFFYPLQLAVDNAITNLTEIPDTYMFTRSTQKEEDEWSQQRYMEDVITIMVITFYVSVLIPIGHIVTTITNERAKGLSTLIDAMGGGAVARVSSNILSFGILYLPCWIVSGVLYWHYLFPASNAGLLILWNILFGWALTNASIMAAAFFKGNRVSGICVAIGFTAPAAGAAVLLNRHVQTSEVLGYSFVFPTMNFIFSLSTMARHQIAGKAIDLSPSVPPKQTIDPYFLDQTYHVSLGTLFGFLALQIVFYPLLAVLFEKLLHGINLKRRTLSSTHEAQSSSLALEVSNVRKTYRPPWYKAVLFSGKKVLALDGLSIAAQKNQILCLLGVNGSGKTTTLDLISGFQAPTAGEIKINASSTSLGICPQKNVLFSHLTVYEHIRFWSDIKGGHENRDAIHQLIEACDLTKKTHVKATNLSGGQKRKLQLACMFVGGSTVCLMDEVTTGLDPLSRRVIWNIIRAERSKRSMVFTTHFLDEGEVLADHIVILSQGQIKCQGSSTELKNSFGGGYQVHIPVPNDNKYNAPEVDIPATIHQDRLIYTVADSQSAGKLIQKLEAAGISEVEMAGPTIEDVFLNLTNDIAEVPEKSNTPRIVETVDPTEKDSSIDDFTKVSRDSYSFTRQVAVLFRKRCTVLIRYWIAPFLCLLIPIVVTPQLNHFLYRYRRPTCDVETIDDTYSSSMTFWNSYGTEFTLAGPPSYNRSLFEVLDTFAVGENFNTSLYNDQFNWTNTFQDFQQSIVTNHTDIYPSAFWFGDESSKTTLAYLGDYGAYGAVTALNIYSQVKSGLSIEVALQDLPYKVSGSTGDSSLQYVLYVCVLFTVYPAFFALYPAYEKAHQIRSLQYSNGVRPLPLWTAHLLFDIILVFLNALAITLIIQAQYSDFWFQAGYLFPVLFLYGIAGSLLAYVMAVLARSQFAAFLYTVGVMALQFLLVALSVLLIQGYVDPTAHQSTTDAVTFSLGLIFPIMNVFKALAVGLNLFKVACRNDSTVAYPGSIYAYGGPILILCLQILLFSLLLILTDRDLSLPAIFKRQRKDNMDEAGLAPQGAISDEVVRVKQSESDLLRLIHVSKSFKSTVAVDDVSLGLGQGEILALLGPNGAGKTTIVNMIRGEFKPDSGNIYLKDVDVHKNTRLAQRSLGVCPQFDALDLLTARQHLEFYARIKGVKNVKGAVNSVMAKVGLTPHASKAASKLSGGNKRKLSLGIALIGNPDVLLLDEPSSSMDAAAKRAMWKILADIAPGRSLLLTTHSMEEADALATRAAIVSKRLLALGTTQVLRQKYSNLYHVQLVLKSAPSSTSQEMQTVEQWIREHFDGIAFEGENLGGQIKFMIPNNSTIKEDSFKFKASIEPVSSEVKYKSVIAKLIDTLEANKETLGLIDYSIGAPTLEQVFLSVVQDNEVYEEEKKKNWWSWML